MCVCRYVCVCVLGGRSNARWVYVIREYWSNRNYHVYTHSHRPFVTSLYYYILMFFCFHVLQVSFLLGTFCRVDVEDTFQLGTVSGVTPIQLGTTLKDVSVSPLIPVSASSLSTPALEYTLSPLVPQPQEPSSPP